jgi:molybdopterin synthase sulfur carrier subunit
LLIMARLFIPPMMRSMTADRDVVEVPGATIREAIDALDGLYPGTRALLCRDGQLRPGLMVAIDSAIATSGLREPLAENSEVHFLPAIGGG